MEEFVINRNNRENIHIHAFQKEFKVVAHISDKLKVNSTLQKNYMFTKKLILEGIFSEANSL